MLKVATPPDNVTPPGVRSVPPSVKSTVPVGIPGLPGAVTAALNVTTWPNADGLGDELTAVAVTNWGDGMDAIQVAHRLVELPAGEPAGTVAPAYSWSVQMVLSSVGSTVVVL